MQQSTSSSRKRTVYKTSIIFLLLVLVSGAGLISCQQKPELLNVDNIRVLEIRDSVMALQVDCYLYNPGVFSTTVKQLNIDTYYDGVKLGKSSLNREAKLRARDTSVFDTHISLSLKKLEELYPRFSKDSLGWLVKGKGTFGFMGLKLKRKINEEPVINIQKFLDRGMTKLLNKSFKIRSVRLAQLPSASTTKLEAEIGFYNDFSMDYTVEKAHLKFFMEDSSEPLTEWVSDNPIQVGANSEVNIPVKLKLNNMNALTQIGFSWLGGKEISMSAKGFLTLRVARQTFTIPVQNLRIDDVEKGKFF